MKSRDAGWFEWAFERRQINGEIEEFSTVVEKNATGGVRRET
jgi:hypothetical protein